MYLYYVLRYLFCISFFFFNDTVTTETYTYRHTLSLHDSLPISQYRPSGCRRADEQIQVVGLRRRIAENMAASKRHIPHFSYVEEIDVTKLEAMREDINANRGGRPKLTMLPLLIIAVCKAVAQFPMMNARYDDEAGLVIRSGAVHLGIATQTDAGLMVH